MIYTWRIARTGFEEEAEIKLYPKPMTFLLIALGCAGLIGGGRVIVVNAVKLARSLGVTDKLIGLTIVAIGTSLPELATTAVAAYRKKFDIAVGNVVGSNIFNLMLVLGLSGMVHPVTYDPVMNVDLLVLLGGSLLLFGFMFSGQRYRLDRWEAALLLAGYAGYVVFLVKRGVKRYSPVSDASGWAIFRPPMFSPLGPASRQGESGCNSYLPFFVLDSIGSRRISVGLGSHRS